MTPVNVPLLRLELYLAMALLLLWIVLRAVDRELLRRAMRDFTEENRASLALSLMDLPIEAQAQIVAILQQYGQTAVVGRKDTRHVSD